MDIPLPPVKVRGQNGMMRHGHIRLVNGRLEVWLTPQKRPEHSPDLVFDDPVALIHCIQQLIPEG